MSVLHTCCTVSTVVAVGTCTHCVSHSVGKLCLFWLRSGVCMRSPKELLVNQSGGSAWAPFTQLFTLPVWESNFCHCSESWHFHLNFVPGGKKKRLFPQKGNRRELFFLSFVYYINFRQVFTSKGAEASSCSWADLVIVITSWLHPSQACSLSKPFAQSPWPLSCRHSLFSQFRHRDIWTFHNLSF